MNKLLKRIVFDATGILLIIIAVSIGWLPGPGGIPLALIGLGLLAKNNKWARDLLDDFEEKFKFYSNKIMHASPRLRIGLDFVVLSLMVLSIYLLLESKGFYKLLGSVFITSGLILLLLNRGRGMRILKKISRKKT